MPREGFQEEAEWKETYRLGSPIMSETTGATLIELGSDELQAHIEDFSIFTRLWRLGRHLQSRQRTEHRTLSQQLS